MDRQGYTQTLVKCVYSDVSILAHAYADIAQQAGLEMLFLVYGPEEKYYNALENVDNLGVNVCKALPFFHAFTGCDTVSSFYQHGKAKFWKEWQDTYQHDQTLTEVFKDMSDQPGSIDERSFNIICSFVYRVYGIDASKNSSFKSLRTN